MTWWRKWWEVIVTVAVAALLIVLALALLGGCRSVPAATSTSALAERAAEVVKQEAQTVRTVATTVRQQADSEAPSRPILGEAAVSLTGSAARLETAAGDVATVGAQAATQATAWAEKERGYREQVKRLQESGNKTQSTLTAIAYLFGILGLGVGLFVLLQGTAFKLGVGICAGSVAVAFVANLLMRYGHALALAGVWLLAACLLTGVGWLAWRYRQGLVSLIRGIDAAKQRMPAGDALTTLRTALSEEQRALRAQGLMDDLRGKPKTCNRATA